VYKVKAKVQRQKYKVVGKCQHLSFTILFSSFVYQLLQALLAQSDRASDGVYPVRLMPDFLREIRGFSEEITLAGGSPIGTHTEKSSCVYKVLY
jgi:hypothetical protein